MQEPAAAMWRRLPFTVHRPEAAKLTARPEEAVAPSPKSGSPYVRPFREGKEMVWFALTWVASAAVSLPGVSSPLPLTVTRLVRDDGASAATSTMSVIGG